MFVNKKWYSFYCYLFIWENGNNTYFELRSYCFQVWYYILVEVHNSCIKEYAIFSVLLISHKNNAPIPGIEHPHPLTQKYCFIGTKQFPRE